MDWSLLGCWRSGHLTYAPDEPRVRERLSLSAGDKQAWQCLRCGAFVVGQPGMSGPASQAPPVRRGSELRSAIILRLFAIERFLRALLVALVAVVVWRLGSSRESVEQAFDREIPLVRELVRQFGYNIDRSKLVGLIHHALTLSPAMIRLVAVGLAAYAVIEVVEGTGLWLLRRWGEYFSMVATSLGLPIEIYDLASRVTVIRLLFFLVNLFLVLYLVITKRLFGVRGGRRAYDARLRSESIMNAAVTGAAGQDAGSQAGSSPAAQADTHAASKCPAPESRRPARRR
jgi:uncharacterized membrane protein (DUF2068 family)